ncbi:MAG: threonine/serine exporter family protein [Campylobacteraceae bacterium]|nr:threonine/serine exporter family protein [Campylobacteraceae bacterium]
MNNQSIDILKLSNFLADYADALIGAGAYNARVIRCAKRIAKNYGYDVSIFVLLKFINITVTEIANPKNQISFIKDTTERAINLDMVSELSALSWAVHDEHLSLNETRGIFNKILKPKKTKLFLTSVIVSVAFGSFCGLFGGDLGGMLFVMLGTFFGITARNFLIAKKIDLRIAYIVAAFISSFVAYSSFELGFSLTPEAAISASILYLFPGVVLLNSMFDILDRNVLIGISRAVNAGILILCMSVGMYITLLLVNFGLVT